MYINQWLEKVKLFYSYYNNDIINECYILLKYILKKSISWIIINSKIFKLNYIKLVFLNSLLYRRLKGEPIYYIINKFYFLSFKYKIYFDIFIPRQDSEIMVEFIIYLIKINNFNKILDLGTGSGVIAISISKYFSNIYILGLDINKLCINLAKYNSLKLNTNNVFFKKSNWFSYLKKNKNLFHIIISNPPYLNKYNDNIKFESYISLISNNNGLKDIIYIILNSYDYLYNYGWLIIEHCFSQLDVVIFFFNFKGYFNIFSYKDYNNKFRFTIGQKIIN